MHMYVVKIRKKAIKMNVFMGGSQGKRGNNLILFQLKPYKNNKHFKSILNKRKYRSKNADSEFKLVETELVGSEL